MNREKCRRATEILASLDSSLADGGEKGAAPVAREAIAAATHVLGDETASWKASDYALARAHAKLARLIGYGDLELTETARAAWRDLEDLVYGEARDDLRGVGGPNLG